MKPIDVIRENFKARKELIDEMRAVDEAAVGREYTDEETKTVEECRSKLSAIDSRVTNLLDMETRSADIRDATDRLLGAMYDKQNEDVIDTRSLGERFIGMDGLMDWAGGAAKGNSPVLWSDTDFRAVTNITLGATSGGAMTRAQRLDRMGQDFIDRRTYLMDLLPSINVTQGSVEYVQDQSPLADLANAAVEVAEGTAKPQAGPTLAVVSEPTPTLAAWVNVTRQAAADVPQLQSYIDGRLRYSLKRRADAQIINGNGTAPNIKGLLQRTGIVSYAPGSAEARYISIRHAIRLMEDNESVPEIIVLNPADAELFDLSNAASAGIHATPDATGGLRQGPSRTAWGLTQVHSTAIASGTAMLVDPTGVAILDRQQVATYMTDSHASNFVSNILTVLLEMRIGLALFTPKSVASITFNGTA